MNKTLQNKGCGSGIEGLRSHPGSLWRKTSQTKLYKPSCSSPTDTSRMETDSLFIDLIMSLILCMLNPLIAMNVPCDDLTRQGGLKENKAGTGVSKNVLSLKCDLQGTVHLPAFSMDGDYVIGGVFSIHHYREYVKHEYTSSPEPSRCKGRSVKMCCGLMFNL